MRFSLFKFQKQAVSAILVVFSLWGGACVRRNTASLPPLQLSLHSGLEGLVRLNDSEQQMTERSTVKAIRREIPTNSSLGALRFTHFYEVKESGIKAYFRGGRVGLIEIQDPFTGTIVGKRIQIFPFNRRDDKSWEETLIREFGSPLEKSSGGRLSSDLLLYNWGDIAFNGLGPNQIAIYRDYDIAAYRRQNFGRVIRFWN